MSNFILTPELATRFADIALGHVTREYPYKLDHVMTGPEDVLAPSALHPIFHGSFDWHSCVHGYWTLLRIRRLFPDLPVAARIEALADAMLTPGKVAGELAYLARPGAAGFERPYGWAWLLALHDEASRAEGKGWEKALAPLARAFADRFAEHLPKLSYPIRVGTHSNTAFSLILALGWADMNDAVLSDVISERARDYFLGDRDCPGWEPGGDHFLSEALTEALLMRRVLTPDSFADWLGGFLPRLGERQPATLFTPAFVSDRSDGKIAHLDGLNLSRAWCWRGIADALPAGLSALADDAANRHLDASLRHVAGDYMGEHWLASFALLALEGQ